MKTIRFLLLPAVVLMLVAVVLSSACTGSKGEEGPQGPAGNDGTDGVGIESAVDNGDGTFTLTFTDGTTFTTDDLTGPQGEQGIQGIQGTQGIQGIQGIQGLPGPNWIAAMARVHNFVFMTTTTTIWSENFSVASVSWDSADEYYRIDLTFDYVLPLFAGDAYVTLVSPESVTLGAQRTAKYWADGTDLCVQVFDQTGAPMRGNFSFMVLKMS